MSITPGSKDSLLLMQQRFPQYFQKKKPGDKSGSATAPPALPTTITTIISTSKSSSQSPPSSSRTTFIGTGDVSGSKAGGGEGNMSNANPPTGGGKKGATDKEGVEHFASTCPSLALPIPTSSSTPENNNNNNNSMTASGGGKEDHIQKPLLQYLHLNGMNNNGNGGDGGLALNSSALFTSAMSSSNLPGTLPNLLSPYVYSPRGGRRDLGKTMMAIHEITNTTVIPLLLSSTESTPHHHDGLHLQNSNNNSNSASAILSCVAGTGGGEYNHHHNNSGSLRGGNHYFSGRDWKSPLSPSSSAKTTAFSEEAVGECARGSSPLSLPVSPFCPPSSGANHLQQMKVKGGGGNLFPSPSSPLRFMRGPPTSTAYGGGGATCSSLPLSALPSTTSRNRERGPEKGEGSVQSLMEALNEKGGELNSSVNGGGGGWLQGSVSHSFFPSPPLLPPPALDNEGSGKRHGTVTALPPKFSTSDTHGGPNSPYKRDLHRVAFTTRGCPTVSPHVGTLKSPQRSPLLAGVGGASGGGTSPDRPMSAGTSNTTTNNGGTGTGTGDTPPAPAVKPALTISAMAGGDPRDYNISQLSSNCNSSTGNSSNNNKSKNLLASGTTTTTTTHCSTGTSSHVHVSITDPSLTASLENPLQQICLSTDLPLPGEKMAEGKRASGEAGASTPSDRRSVSPPFTTFTSEEGLYHRSVMEDDEEDPVVMGSSTSSGGGPSSILQGGTSLCQLGKSSSASPFWQGPHKAGGEGRGASHGRDGVGAVAVGGTSAGSSEKVAEKKKNEGGGGGGIGNGNEGMTGPSRHSTKKEDDDDDDDDEVQGKGKRKNPFEHVKGCSERAGGAKRKKADGPGSHSSKAGRNNSPGGGGSPAPSSTSSPSSSQPPNQLASALLQSMRRKQPSAGARAKPGGGGSGTGSLVGTKELLRQLHANVLASKGGGDSTDGKGGGNSNTNTSSDSDSNSNEDGGGEDGDALVANAPAPYVASVGNVKVKHRERSSVVSFSDQFPERHDSQEGRIGSISRTEGRSSFLAWSTTDEAFLPRVRMGKQRILRF